MPESIREWIDAHRGTKPGVVSADTPVLITAEAIIHLVQMLLPLYDNEGNAFPGSHYEGVRAELTERFGGLTAYTRAPAQGLWAEDGEPPQRDDIVVYEVMAETLDRSWWRGFRKLLEHRFAQEELIIRSQEIERL